MMIRLCCRRLRAACPHGLLQWVRPDHEALSDEELVNLVLRTFQQPVAWAHNLLKDGASLCIFKYWQKFL